MFRRRRVVAACLALSFVGLCLLFLHARSITPRDLGIAEIGGDDVGAPVRVRGHVHRVWTTDEGNAGLVLLDYGDFATVRVIARPKAVSHPTLVAPGAFVEVTGTVFGSGGTIQIFAEDLGAVAILAPPSTNLVSLEFVARNAARLEGEHVVVRGLLADVRTIVDGRHALLQADGSELWAYDPSGWNAGRANVTGRLTITSMGRCELFVGEEPHAVEATLAALAGCPQVFLGEAVIVRNVAVTPGEVVGTALSVRDLGDGAEFRLAAFVRGWDWRREAPSLRLGDLITIEGVVEYQATEARYRVLCGAPPRR